MFSGVIYCYTNKTNGKCYIGLTKNEAERKIQHVRDAMTYNSKRPFHCAIRKYGVDGFAYEVLASLENEDELQLKNQLSELEIKYIEQFDSYRNGYNATFGGDGCSGIKHSEDEKLAKSIRQGRPVLKYTLNKEFIAEYASSGIAARSVESKSKWEHVACHIADCCNNRCKTAYGYIWAYK